MSFKIQDFDSELHKELKEEFTVFSSLFLSMLADIMCRVMQHIFGLKFSLYLPSTTVLNKATKTNFFLDRSMSLFAKKSRNSYYIDQNVFEIGQLFCSKSDFIQIICLYATAFDASDYVQKDLSTAVYHRPKTRTC